MAPAADSGDKEPSKISSNDPRSFNSHSPHPRERRPTPGPRIPHEGNRSASGCHAKCSAIIGGAEPDGVQQQRPRRAARLQRRHERVRPARDHLRVPLTARMPGRSTRQKWRYSMPPMLAPGPTREQQRRRPAEHAPGGPPRHRASPLGHPEPRRADRRALKSWPGQQHRQGRSQPGPAVELDTITAVRAARPWRSHQRRATRIRRCWPAVVV